MGFVLLEGGNEFSGAMDAPDRRAIELCGGNRVPVRIIPAAAAPDQNQARAGANGTAWFQSLGAADVKALDIIDRASADRLDLAAEVEGARLVFLLGGFPRHLAETLSGSRTWRAILNAQRSGAVIAGSSAGAMVLCERYFDPESDTVLKGLKLVPGACVIPHHERFGRSWAAKLAPLLPEVVLIGIDEETGLINDGPEGSWAVYGKGAVTLYWRGRREPIHHGQNFELPPTGVAVGNSIR
jgi:cyanophycinase